MRQLAGIGHAASCCSENESSEVENPGEQDARDAVCHCFVEDSAETEGAGEHAGHYAACSCFLEGSLTVEASFLFPVLILLLAFILNMAIGLYETVDRTAADWETVKNLDSTEMFLNTILVQDMIHHEENADED